MVFLSISYLGTVQKELLNSAQDLKVLSEQFLIVI